jgi:hypothetical protein
MQMAHVDVVAMSDQWIETSTLSMKTRGNPGTCRSGVDVPRHTREISNIRVGIIATPRKNSRQA